MIKRLLRNKRWNIRSLLKSFPRDVEEKWLRGG
jgi:hypothetical protein